LHFLAMFGSGLRGRPLQIIGIIRKAPSFSCLASSACEASGIDRVDDVSRDRPAGLEPYAVVDGLSI
jgi:hypothetical protein